MEDAVGRRVPIDEAARLLGLHPESVRRNIKQGRYPWSEKRPSKHGEQWWLELPEDEDDAPLPGEDGAVLRERLRGLERERESWERERQTLIERIQTAEKAAEETRVLLLKTQALQLPMPEPVAVLMSPPPPDFHPEAPRDLPDHLAEAPNDPSTTAEGLQAPVVGGQEVHKAGFGSWLRRYLLWTP